MNSRDCDLETRRALSTSCFTESTCGSSVPGCSVGEAAADELLDDVKDRGCFETRPRNPSPVWAIGDWSTTIAKADNDGTDVLAGDATWLLRCVDVAELD